MAGEGKRAPRDEVRPLAGEFPAASTEQSGVANGVLQAVLHTAVDAIITIDVRGTIQSVNPATCRLFGYTPAELIGGNVTILMPEPFRSEHDGYMQNYLTTREARIIGVGREVVGRRRDGTTFPLHLAVSEFKVDGQTYFAGIVRDISDLKQAEMRLTELNNQLELRVQERTEQLRLAQAELVAKERLATLGQVAGGIAHEIRNPLNAVKTSVYYLLHAQSPTPEKMREHLERIDRQVTSINQVVTALSDVARLPEPTLVPVSVSDLLDDVLRSVSLGPQISVVKQIPPLMAVLGDPLQLPLLFRNLVRNARDAMPQGGVLTLQVEESGDRVEISVADSGVGIAPEDLPRIIEPLYSTKARGMGLGLAIARSIVDKNRGEMKVTSEVGRGSRFTISLQKGT